MRSEQQAMVDAIFDATLRRRSEQAMLDAIERRADRAESLLAHAGGHAARELAQEGLISEFTAWYLQKRHAEYLDLQADLADARAEIRRRVS